MSKSEWTCQKLFTGDWEVSISETYERLGGVAAERHRLRAVVSGGPDTPPEEVEATARLMVAALEKAKGGGE